MRRQQNEPRSFEETVRHYEELYRGKGYGSSPTTTQHLALNAHPFFRRRGVTSILDIGCGRGDLLLDWEGRKYRVAGTEIVPSLLAGPLKVFSEIYPYSVLDLWKLAEDSFDVVTLVDILDHLQTKEELAAAVHQASRIAKKGVLVTVNAEPPGSEQSVQWSIYRWEGIVRSMYPEGRVDVTVRKGVRFIAWKEFSDARSSHDADARRESGSTPDVQRHPDPDRGEDAGGEDSRPTREPEESKGETR